MMRIVALLLLLGAASELARDFLANEPSVNLADLSSSCTDEGDSDCFCCCVHVMVKHTPEFPIRWYTQENEEYLRPSCLPAGIIPSPFHPPKA